MAVESNRVDAIQSFEGGMNQSLPPPFLPQNQTIKNINVSLVNGHISPRPAFRERKIDMVSEGSYTHSSISHERNFSSGRIQHSGRFNTRLGEFLMLVINGLVYAINTRTNECRYIEVPDFPHTANYTAPRLHGLQAYNYYVIADYPNNAIIIDDEFNVRRAVNSNQDVPAHYVSAFVHNRLFPANKGIEFGASDPVRPDNPDAPISFKESIVSDTNPSPQFPNQFFSLSYIDRLSNISAMGYFEDTNASSSIGYGPLFVSTKEAIYLYPVNKPRVQWSESIFGTVLVHKIGMVGPRAFVNVGGDIWYRSSDGYYYSIKTISGDQQKWGISNISREIADSLMSTSTDLMQYSVMGYYDNKIYCSLVPRITRCVNLFGLPIEDYVFSGVGVVELNSISGLQGGSPPVWSSLYNIDITNVVELSDKLLFIGKSAHNDNINAIYEYSTEHFTDLHGDVEYPIKSRIYTKEVVMEAPLQHKKLTHVHLDIRDITGPLKVSLYYDVEGCWEHISSIQTTCQTNLDNEFMQIPDAILTKAFRLRIDLEGTHYKFIRAFLVADINTDLDTQHNLDICQPEEFIEDYDL